MLNSKDVKSRGLFVDYFFEFKEAIKNYKNFEEVAITISEQIKTNPIFVLSCVFYNTKTKRFFINPTKFYQHSIIVYNNFNSIFSKDSETPRQTFTDIERFRDFLSEKLEELSWSSEVSNEYVLSFNLVSYNRVASGEYGIGFNQNDLKKYFIKNVDTGVSQYFFDPYTLTPTKIKYGLNLTGVVLEIYISALIEDLSVTKREFSENLISSKDTLRSFYNEKLYRLFLLSGIKFDELGDNIKRGLQETFKWEWFRLLSWGKIQYAFREEVFSTFWVYEKFLNEEESNLFPDEKWLSIFESFENLNLLKRFKYIYKILTGFGLKKFKAVNVLISEQ